MLKLLKRFFYSLFFGMKGADDLMSSPIIPDSEIHESITEHELVVDEVTVDKSYRVFREANNYDVKLGGLIKETGDENDTFENEPDITAIATKKVFLDTPFSEHLETEGYRIILVQYAKEYENDTETRAKEAERGEEINGNTNIFTIERDDVPRFYLESYLRQVVLKENKEGKNILELYFSVYQKQFWKLHALFLREMERVLNDKRQPDIFDFKTISFVTDKAFGCPDIFKYTISPTSYRGIAKYDGNYVVAFDCDIAKEDLTEKYRTKELDELYATKAPKHDNIDINTIIRNQNDNSN